MIKNWNKAFASILTNFNKLKNHQNFKTMVFAVIVLVLVFLNVFQGITLVQDRYHMNVLKEELHEAQSKKDVLAEEIESYQTNQYIEEKAKTTLGMVKSGETPIKIYEVEPKEKKELQYIEPKEKISIYMKDWYIKLEEWFLLLKK